MIAVLGGPGVGCSAMRVRRLEAGELAGEERARTAAHLEDCARCQAVRRELSAERARLAMELPFEELAAGVADRLARAPARRPWRSRAVGLALAAGLAAVAAAPIVSHVLEDRTGTRTKGGADVTIHVRDGGGVHALAPAEAVPAGAPLRLSLAPGGRRYAAVALVDADGVAILWAGPARPGPLPGAFEWTGSGEATLVVVLGDAPVDTAALARRLGEGGPAAAAVPGAEVVVRALRRGAP